MAAFQARREQGLKAYDMADSIESRISQAAVMDASFVLEADAVTFKRGTRVQVNSATNFISVKDGRAVVQVSPSYFYSGPNGVGGITVDGTVSGVTVKTDKKGNIRYSMNVTGVGISARVDISLRDDSTFAYAVVSPNFNSNTIRMDGRIVPYSRSRVITQSAGRPAAVRSNRDWASSQIPETDPAFFPVSTRANWPGTPAWDISRV